MNHIRMSLTRTLTFGIALLASAHSAFAALSDEEKMYLESFGWIIGQQSGMAQLGLSQEEFDALLVGLNRARDLEEAGHNLQLIGPDMNVFLQGKAEANRAHFEEKMTALQASAQKLAEEEANINKEKALAFITDLEAANESLEKTDSGLYYEVIEAGEEKPSADGVVKVHYEGRLINGELFDSSVERGEPATFPLGSVIEGWREGIQLIGEGGKIKLYIPSDLAYGDEGRPGIPPGAMLVFDVDLLEIIRPDKEVTGLIDEADMPIEAAPQMPTE